VANGYIGSVCTVYELHSGEWLIRWKFVGGAKTVCMDVSFLNYSFTFGLVIVQAKMSMECHSREQMKNCYVELWGYWKSKRSVQYSKGRRRPKMASNSVDSYTYIYR
jgi:hypothetical protein